MRFWIREVAGWLLVALGLYIFYICFLALFVENPPFIIEIGILAFIGFIVFRGGIHLLKVAVAARVCMEAGRTREKVKAKKDVKRVPSLAGE